MSTLAPTSERRCRTRRTERPVGVHCPSGRAVWTGDAIAHGYRTSTQRSKSICRLSPGLVGSKACGPCLFHVGDHLLGGEVGRVVLKSDHHAVERPEGMGLIVDPDRVEQACRLEPVMLAA